MNKKREDVSRIQLDSSSKEPITTNGIRNEKVTLAQTSSFSCDECPLLVPFSTPLESVDVKQIGGKAWSLIRLNQAALKEDGKSAIVPDGGVLSTRFFQPWIDAVVGSSEWFSVMKHLQEHYSEASGSSKLSHEHRTVLEELCEKVVHFASKLELTPEQSTAIDDFETKYGSGPFAVRSSSPEEDLEGASFAGQYETVLNVVGKSALVDAVRVCFNSCLSPRVLLYKSRKMVETDSNVSVSSPSVAVVFQCMVKSDVSGVAFSINPVTNDYDELLINASWGLGESVVSGDVTPDSVVVDKVKFDVVDYRLGEKGAHYRSGEKCLSDEQATDLAAVVAKIEAIYSQPMDVEWAYEKNQLYLLQARPITAYVPLEERLLTEPGAPRRLYLDNYLRKGVTMSVSTTPMVDDIMVTVAHMLYGWLLGYLPEQEVDLDAGGVHVHSRAYMDVSMWLHLISPKKIAKLSDAGDVMIARVLGSPEIERYRPKVVPSNMSKFRLLLRLPGILWRGRCLLTSLYEPTYNPDKFEETFDLRTKEFEKWVTGPLDLTQSVRNCLEDGMKRAAITALDSSYPAVVIFMRSAFKIKDLADPESPEQRRLVDSILGGHEGDMVIEMGMAMFDMASLLPQIEFEDVHSLAEKVKKRDLPKPFLDCWDRFVNKYGCRGPLEMEIANPKYGEEPILALQQIAGIASAADECNPHEMHKRRIKQRDGAYKELLEVLPKWKVKRLEKYYDLYTRYAAHREVPKHQIMQVFSRMRQLLLHRANEFVKAGRLDVREHIFQLHMDDVDQAMENSELDLRSLVDKRGALYRKQRDCVRHFPLFIDSRGRILRLPPKLEEGSLVGAAVSSGKASGPVKVLNDPTEKEVVKGDVIVAVATDPGWTPLFVGASAVILEVGGELQHGALIAREYGKPCVSGIQDVTRQFHDGQLVEVDGDAGVVRFVDTTS